MDNRKTYTLDMRCCTEQQICTAIDQVIELAKKEGAVEGEVIELTITLELQV